jgi:cell division protease FtsH
MIRLDSPELIGLEQVRQTLNNVLYFLTNADAMIRAGQNMPRTLLLTGPSSCGKTLSIKALINTLTHEFLANKTGKKVNYVEIDPSKMRSGATSRWGTLDYEIIKALSYADGPTIIFIDEIHLLNLRQDGDTALLAEFLDRLRRLEDITDPDKIVMIIAATNKKDLLAPELRMHGRFSTQIEFKLPGQTERSTYFTHFLKDLGGIELDSQDIARFVQLTNGCNYGHLNEIITAAKLRASREGRGILAADIELEIYTKVFGIIDTSLQSIKQLGTSEQELLTVAAHQAGKLVAYTITKPSISCVFASICRVRDPMRASTPFVEMFAKQDKGIAGINKNNTSYGICAFIDPHEEVHITTKQEQIKRIKILLAGLAAQDILNAEGVSVYGQQDRDEALAHLKNLHLRGIKPETLSQQQLDAYTAQAFEQLLTLEQEIKQELIAHQDLLQQTQYKLLTQTIVTPHGTLEN